MTSGRCFDDHDHDDVHTYDHSANERVLKDPAGGDIGDAESTVAIAHVTEYCQECLEEGPGTPRFQDHIQILDEGMMST